MKIINRQSFLKMPQGTFFAKGERWFFEGFCIKGETITTQEGENIDFYCQDLIGIDYFNSGELYDRQEDSLANGTSYPIDKCEQRDGMFNDEDIFLIFENEDLKYICDCIMKQSCIQE